MNERDRLLVVDDLDVAYGEARALFGVSLSVSAGQALAVLGANGAGKSSLAAAIAGVITPAPRNDPARRRGHHEVGTAPRRQSRHRLRARRSGDLSAPHGHRQPASDAARRGAAGARRGAAVERALEVFPVLRERRRQHAGTLSGGEQQMLALARVLAAPPRLLVADEMSLGLAPRMVDVVFDGLQQAKDAAA